MLKLLIILFSIQSFAEEDKAVIIKDWTIKNESSASAIIASGNTDSETTSIKQQNQVFKKNNNYIFRANFLRTKDDGVESGKSWLLGLRYERELSELLRAFLGISTERDIFSGFNRRKSADLGLKYFLI